MWVRHMTNDGDTIHLPDDAKYIGGVSLHVKSGGVYPLELVGIEDFDEMRSQAKTEVVGFPAYCCVREEIELWPKPNAEYEFSVSYEKADALSGAR